MLVCAPCKQFEARLDTFFSRLKDERLRLDLNQTEFAEMAGVQKRAQVNYEAGERSPDAKYLTAIAAAGADVLYILTGQRTGGTTASPSSVRISAEEQTLLSYFRNATDEAKRAAFAALLGALALHSGAHQTFQGNVTGGVAGRDYVKEKRPK